MSAAVYDQFKAGTNRAAATGGSGVPIPCTASTALPTPADPFVLSLQQTGAVRALPWRTIGN